MQINELQNQFKELESKSQIAINQFISDLNKDDTDLLECTLNEYQSTLSKYIERIPLLNTRIIDETLYYLKADTYIAVLREHLKTVEKELYTILADLADTDIEYDNLQEKLYDLYYFHRLVDERFCVETPYFEEKSQQVFYQGKLKSFGITINSRYDRAKEIIEMINFTYLLARYQIEHLVKDIYYESGSCLCTFTLCDSVQEFDESYTLIAKAASKTISQYQLYDYIDHGKPMYDSFYD